ncbi:MAG TPA: DUF2252 family protein [Oscillatoriaceae cyanobacterium]
MGLQELTRKVVSDLVPAAAKRAGAVDRLVSDQAGSLADSLALGDRSAPSLIGRLNQGLAKKAPERLKLKYQHMAISPRRFLTGQPELYAYDMRGLLAQDVPKVPLLGDLHLNNSGAMTLANGHVKVRLNDFDEAYPGPAAFDLNRMATHIVLSAQEKGYSEADARKLVSDFAGSYHDTLSALAAGEKPAKVKMPALLKDVLKKGKSSDAQKWLDKRVPEKNGQRAFPRSDSVRSVKPKTLADMQQAFEGYRAGLAPEAAQALAPYHVSDMVEVLEGTGSMGEARYHVLLEGKGKQTPMLLQLKEQGLTAPERYGPRPEAYPSSGARNVTLSNLMDGGLDPLRGSATLPARDSLDSGSYLVEPLHPSDGALDIGDVKKKRDFSQLVRYYGAEVAKAQARGADAGFATPGEILGGLGDRKTLTQGLARFGTQYAAQVNQDFAAFTKALKRDLLLKHQAN